MSNKDIKLKVRPVYVRTVVRPISIVVTYEFYKKNWWAILLNLAISLAASIPGWFVSPIIGLIIVIVVWVICTFLLPPTVTKIKEIRK